MSRLKYSFYLSTLVWHFIDCHAICRPTSDCKPLIQKEDSYCKYYENPVLIPIFRARMNNQQCYPAESPNGKNVYSNGATENQDTVRFKSRNPYFPNPNQNSPAIPPNPERKNIQFEYFNDDLTSIGDLAELNSDEISLPHPPVNKEPIKLWKVDEVKSMTTPQFLPDVLLAPEDHGIIALENTGVPVETLIDEHERHLGRFVVDDSPPAHNVLNIPNPQLTQVPKDIDNIQVDEKYVRNPHPTVPEVVVDKITKLNEPDFMEELRQMKLASQSTPASYVVEPYIEKTFTEPSSIETTTESVTSLPVLESTTISTTEKTNVIGRDPTIKSSRRNDSKRRESRKRHRKTEKKVEEVSEDPTAVLTPAPLTAKTDHLKEIQTNTSTRFAGNYISPMDGLLSVM